MTTRTAASPSAAAFLAGLRDASPLMWRTSMAFLAGFAICLLLQAIDPRLLNGISVWVKPAKFFLSLALHMLTLAWGITLLPPDSRNGRGMSIAVGVMTFAAIGEMIYIVFRAGLGDASHFNVATPLSAALYQLMGMGAASMMLATIWIGWRILRDAPRGNPAFAAGIGFILAAILTLITAFTLGGMGSHWIGGDRTDATGLPVFGWSTTGGDLRVSHFVALHTMQALPLVALLGGRALILAAAGLATLLTAATYAQALMGLPLLSPQQV